VAQAKYVTEANEWMTQLHREIAQWENQVGLKRGTPFVIPYPDEVFDVETTLTLGVNPAEALPLRLAHAPGHAADQLVIYHAPTETLWASDILSDVEIPFISHRLSAYEATLTRLSEWPIRVLVPGHGHATTDPANVCARFTADRAYLAELRARVEAAIRAGQSVHETVSACAGMVYRSPEENQPYHQLNIESVYLELGGVADATRIGWNKIE
jgi:glyoxylase-like metal-dependent hydrolase (beta-lactamase superfamily II)